MRRRSVWDAILSSRRSDNRRTRKKSRRRLQGKGNWSGVADAVCFQPEKIDWVPIWRKTYKLKRQLREIERGLYQPTSEKETWLGLLRTHLRSAWHDLVDETKAMFTALLFHLLTLAMIVVFNALWFAALFWLIGAWLDG